jgi:hypothetical protein
MLAQAEAYPLLLASFPQPFTRQFADWMLVFGRF